MSILGIDFTSLTTQIIAGLVVVAIIAILGFFYARSRKRSESVRNAPIPEKAEPIDIQRLVVKKNFYLPIPRDR